jgi:hypothetical protein
MTNNRLCYPEYTKTRPVFWAGYIDKSGTAASEQSGKPLKNPALFAIIST